MREILVVVARKGKLVSEIKGKGGGKIKIGKRVYVEQIFATDFALCVGEEVNNKFSPPHTNKLRTSIHFCPSPFPSCTVSGHNQQMPAYAQAVCGGAPPWRLHDWLVDAVLLSPSSLGSVCLFVCLLSVAKRIKNNDVFFFILLLHSYTHMHHHTTHTGTSPTTTIKHSRHRTSLSPPASHHSQAW